MGVWVSHWPAGAHPWFLPLALNSCPRLRTLGQTEGPLFSFLPLGFSPADRSWLRQGHWWLGTVTAQVSSAQWLRNVAGPGARKVRLRPMVPKFSRRGGRCWEGGEGRQTGGSPGLRAYGGSPTCRCPRTGSPLSSSARLPPLGLGWEGDKRRGDVTGPGLSTLLPRPPAPLAPSPAPLTCRKRRGWA